LKGGKEMDCNTNDYGVAKLQLAWEIVKNIQHFEGKAYQQASEELAKKQAELVTEIFNKLP
jgi:hypothetical protein